MKIIRRLTTPTGGTDSPGIGGAGAAPFFVDAGSVKACRKCHEIKSLEEFFRYKSSPDGRQPICKVCDKAACAARYIKRCERYAGPTVTTKTCSKCKNLLDAEQFYPVKQRKDGLSSICMSCDNNNGKRYRADNGDSYRESVRDRYRKLRIDALEAYGHKCVCCGETRYNFLAIDHTNGGGREQLRRDGIQRSDLTRWLRDQGYPQEGFRILCHSCNSSLGLYGYCPHGGVDPVATVLYLPWRGIAAAQRRFAYKQRVITLDAYGGKCACCDENRHEFLALDHIDGGGTKHIQSLSIPLTEYLYKNKFPSGYQVLCHQCNLSRGFYGFCHGDPPSTPFDHHRNRKGLAA